MPFVIFFVFLTDVSQDSEAVSSFLSSVVQAFLIRHGFITERPQRQRAVDKQPESPRKRRKLNSPGDDAIEAPSFSPSTSGSLLSTRPGTPFITCQDDGAGCIVWTDPHNGVQYKVDKRTGNSYPLHDGASRSDPEDDRTTMQSHKATTHRKTISSRSQEQGEIDTPQWIRKALQVNHN